MKYYNLQKLLNDKDLTEVFENRIQISNTDAFDFVYENKEDLINSYFFFYGTASSFVRNNEFVVEISDTPFIILYNNTDKLLYLFCIDKVDDNVLWNIKHSCKLMTYIKDVVCNTDLNRYRNSPNHNGRIFFSNGAVQVYNKSIIPNIELKEITIKE